jgi:hypothetical protein
MKRTALQQIAPHVPDHPLVNEREGLIGKSMRQYVYRGSRWTDGLDLIEPHDRFIGTPDGKTIVTCIVGRRLAVSVERKWATIRHEFLQDRPRSMARP